MTQEKLQAISAELGFQVPALEIIDQVYAVYQKIDAEIHEKTKGLGLPCKAGCDACCHESVFLCAPEFLVVCAELLATRSPESLTGLVEEMCILAEEFSDELEFLEAVGAGPERDEVAARIKFRCPMLSAEGLCTVYQARELNGRTFGHAWDTDNNEIYGCDLSREHLHIIDQPKSDFSNLPNLPNAREARLALVKVVPLTERVQVYPWWFRKYGSILL